MLALEIGLYVIVLACLFIMKEFFIEDDKGNNFWKRVIALRTKK